MEIANTKRYGIINYSSNCYLNVIIQIFLSYEKTKNIISEYLDIDNNRINPKRLLDKLSDKININIQNDSHEVFILILDLIPELEKYFTNEVLHKFTCLECNNVRNKKEQFSTFFVHHSSLVDSIKDLIKNENFNLECDNCKINTNTYKQCNIEQVGEILIFYNILKQKIKISENIKYRDKNYELIGLIKHIGNKSSGHYFFIDYKNRLQISDTIINPIKDISLTNIYLLFYIII